MTAEELFAVLTGMLKPLNNVQYNPELTEENGFVGTEIEVDGEAYYLQIQPI